MGEDTDRAPVTVYLPAYQKATWVEHAERLEMSQSEFVRTMVQAGRRGFDVAEPDRGGEPPSPDRDPGGTSMEDRVRAALSDGAVLSWDELVDAVVDDVEADLETAIETLQRRNEVRYSGREGGYVADGE